MTSFRVMFFALFFLALPARALLAQQVSTPMPSALPIALESSHSIATYRMDLAKRLERRRVRQRTLIWAGAGFVVGAGATYAVLHSGGSTSLCNRSANQDAMSAGECAGLTVLGGLAGAALGAVVGKLLDDER